MNSLPSQKVLSILTAPICRHKEKIKFIHFWPLELVVLRLTGKALKKTRKFNNLINTRNLIKNTQKFDSFYGQLRTSKLWNRQLTTDK